MLKRLTALEPDAARSIIDNLSQFGFDIEYEDYRMVQGDTVVEFHFNVPPKKVGRLSIRYLAHRPSFCAKWGHRSSGGPVRFAHAFPVTLLSASQLTPKSFAAPYHYAMLNAAIAPPVAVCRCSPLSHRSSALSNKYAKTRASCAKEQVFDCDVYVGGMNAAEQIDRA